MKISRLCLFISTLGPIGYMIASGTVATIISIPFVYWLQHTFANPIHYALFVFLFSVISLLAIRSALKQMRRLDDPSEIVLDEMVGCLITFFAIPLSAQSMIVGLILFNFFGLLKNGHQSLYFTRRFVNEWSIILDDLVVAVLANIILRFIF